MEKRAHTDERIKILLTSTDLTFKQIIEQLKNERISATFNAIRRVNRNHQYRKPRYEAKLTAQQRKELVVLLKNTSKPNLSSLARKFGVCHGSIWYWWDKLSKIREQNNGIIPDDEPIFDQTESIINSRELPNKTQANDTTSINTTKKTDTTSSNATNQEIQVKQETKAVKNLDKNGFSEDCAAYGDDEDVDIENDDDSEELGEDYESFDEDQDINDPLDLSEDKSKHKLATALVKSGIAINQGKIYKDQGYGSNDGDTRYKNYHIKGNDDEIKHIQHKQQQQRKLEPVGQVQAKDLRGQFVKLPIMMYAPTTGPNEAWNLTIKSESKYNSTQSSTSSLSSLSASSSNNSSPMNMTSIATTKSFSGSSSMVKQLKVD